MDETLKCKNPTGERLVTINVGAYQMDLIERTKLHFDRTYCEVADRKQKLHGIEFDPTRFTPQHFRDIQRLNRLNWCSQYVFSQFWDASIDLEWQFHLWVLYVMVVSECQSLGNRYDRKEIQEKREGFTRKLRVELVGEAGPQFDSSGRFTKEYIHKFETQSTNVHQKIGPINEHYHTHRVWRTLIQLYNTNVGRFISTGSMITPNDFPLLCSNQLASTHIGLNPNVFPPSLTQLTRRNATRTLDLRVMSKGLFMSLINESWQKTSNIDTSDFVDVLSCFSLLPALNDFHDLQTITYTLKTPMQSPSAGKLLQHVNNCRNWIFSRH